MTKIYFLLAHGAGANKDSKFLCSIEEKLINIDESICVHRFNFPFMDKRLQDGKSYFPDKKELLLKAYEEQIRQLPEEVIVILAGKSMGGRMASIVLSQLSTLHFSQKIVGGVVFGYPFHVKSKPLKDRTDHFGMIKKPLLIIQGDRDVMGNRDEVTNYNLPKNIKFEWLADGDHDLKPRKKSGHTYDGHLDHACQKTMEFIRLIEKKYH
jgi:predicted alpha/beta-hydrolase family hydrolase